MRKGFSSRQNKIIDRFFSLSDRKLARMFNTEACLNGSFLTLPDSHFYTAPNNPGIDLDQVLAVMEKLRSCDSTIQKLVRFIDLKSFSNRN